MFVSQVDHEAIRIVVWDGERDALSGKFFIPGQDGTPMRSARTGWVSGPC